MKIVLWIVVAVVLVLVAGMLIGNKRRISASELLEGGGLYATPYKEAGGGYRIFKVLKIADEGAYLRLYSNIYQELPKAVDETTLFLGGLNQGKPFGVGHLPVGKGGLKSWGYVFVQASSVAESELDGYREWQEAGGGYF